MSLPPNMKHKKSSPPGDEPSFSLDFTPDVMQPIPNVDFIPGVTSADPPAKKKDDYTIMTQTPYVFHYDVDNKVAMLTKPLEDKILDQVNIRVFDQIQKVVDEVNSGYDYVKKTKILMAQLDYYKELRKYEDVIRKATNLTVESDPYSLEKLQQRICSDHWLGLFFKKVNETRTYGKKLTTDDWRTVKSTIITYYLNYFLQKKTGYAIKQEKLAFFSTLCLRLKQDNRKFQDFTIMELNDSSLTTSFNNTLQSNGKDDIFLPDNLIEKESTFKDDFRRSQYTDIMDLIHAVDRVYNEDNDVENLNKHLKDAGVSPWNLRNIGANILSGLDNTLSGVLSVAGGSGAIAAGGAIATLFGVASLPFWGVTSLAFAGAYAGNRLYNNKGSMWNSVSNFNWNKAFMGPGSDIDGAIIHPTQTAQTYNVSIGQIRKIGDKYIQSGFYNTLCIFVDETLDKCKDAFEAKYGVIEWGKPKTDDVPFNFSDFVNCQQQRKELTELANLVEATNSKLNDVKSAIYDFPKLKSYKEVRDKIDEALIEQLRAFITDPLNLKETVKTDYKDRTELNQFFDKAKKEVAGLSDNAPNKKTKWDLIPTLTFDKFDKKSNGKATFTDGGNGQQSQITTPGHFHHRSPRKSDGGKPKAYYKKSPEYNKLKKSYKDGEISKEKFKQGKHALKRSLKR